jgi:hypothetical protein
MAGQNGADNRDLRRSEIRVAEMVAKQAPGVVERLGHVSS